MGQFHFWTLWLCHNQMDQSRQLSLENQPVQICICIGTVTITCLQNVVSLTPLDTGQNCMFHQTVTNRRRRPSVQHPKKMQVPLEGLE